eukprot:2714861-Rhodomonas_salina.3
MHHPVPSQKIGDALAEQIEPRVKGTSAPMDSFKTYNPIPHHDGFACVLQRAQHVWTGSVLVERCWIDRDMILHCNMLKWKEERNAGCGPER